MQIILVMRMNIAPSKPIHMHKYIQNDNYYIYSMQMYIRKDKYSIQTKNWRTYRFGA